MEKIGRLHSRTDRITIATNQSTMSSSMDQSSLEPLGRYLLMMIGIFLSRSSFCAIFKGSVSPSRSTMTGAFYRAASKRRSKQSSPTRRNEATAAAEATTTTTTMRMQASLTLPLALSSFAPQCMQKKQRPTQYVIYMHIHMYIAHAGGSRTGDTQQCSKGLQQTAITSKKSVTIRSPWKFAAPWFRGPSPSRTLSRTW